MPKQPKKSANSKQIAEERNINRERHRATIEKVNYSFETFRAIIWVIIKASLLVIFVLSLISLVVLLVLSLVYYLNDNSPLATVFLTISQVVTGIASLIVGIWGIDLALKSANNVAKETSRKASITRTNKDEGVLINGVKADDENHDS